MTWQHALQRFGRFALRDDLGPAEHVREPGVQGQRDAARGDRENAFRFEQFSSTRALFLPGGAVPAVGSRLSNPDLAQTYKQIGRDGSARCTAARSGRTSSDRCITSRSRRTRRWCRFPG